LRQGLGHEWGGPLTWVNVRTKIIIIIILKLDMGSTRGKAWVMCQECQLGKIRVNIIFFIIIIVLKLD
jgi:hypothetical protein